MSGGSSDYTAYHLSQPHPIGCIRRKTRAMPNKRMKRVGLAARVLAMPMASTNSLLPSASRVVKAATLPAVTVTGVAVNNSSAKIDFTPVPGAKDYRVFDVSMPNVVKKEPSL
jgi:hypothetical protein